MRSLAQSARSLHARVHRAAQTSSRRGRVAGLGEAEREEPPRTLPGDMRDWCRFFRSAAKARMVSHGTDHPGSHLLRDRAGGRRGGAERLGYVVTLNPGAATGTNGDGKPDALCTVDLDPQSSTYGQMVGRLEMPNAGDELHHFGWNACSLRAVPVGAAPAPGTALPADPRAALVAAAHRGRQGRSRATRRIAKVIEPEEIARKTGYSRPHTSHCGPDGIYMGALGNPDGDGPGGLFLLDHDTLDVKGAWEHDRGPQQLAYDFWWHLGHNTLITSEWGTPNMVEGGVNPEILLRTGTATSCTSGICDARTHKQTIDLGAEHQMVLELRPVARPHQGLRVRGRGRRPRPTCRPRSGCGSATADGSYDARKVITIPAGAGRPGSAAGRAEAVRGGAAAGDRHRPVGGRPLPLRVLLGHR